MTDECAMCESGCKEGAISAKKFCLVFWLFYFWRLGTMMLTWGAQIRPHPTLAIALILTTCEGNLRGARVVCGGCEADDAAGCVQARWALDMGRLVGGARAIS